MSNCNSVEEYIPVVALERNNILISQSFSQKIYFEDIFIFICTSICFSKTLASCEEHLVGTESKGSDGREAAPPGSLSALLFCRLEILRPSKVRCWCAGDSKGEGDLALKWEIAPGFSRSDLESSDCIVLLLTSFELPDIL